MFQLNKDDLSIYATRGDILFFTVSMHDTGEDCKFHPGDVVRIKVFEKKKAEAVVLQKDFPVVMETDSVEIFLSEEDTKMGGVISKPKDYWYEVELNPYNNPQTIIGYDEDGAKVLKLFPEGDDIPEYVPEPEEVRVMDEELDLTSTHPVQNQAIARAVVALRAGVEKNTDGVAMEKVRFDNLISEDGVKISQNLEYLGYISENTKTKIGGEINSDGVHATLNINVREAGFLYDGADEGIFIIPNECRPIEVGLIHTEADIEYVINYDGVNKRYYLSLRVVNGALTAPSEAGIVTMTYKLGAYELRDIRVAANGVIYPTAGEAIRAQINELKRMLSEISGGDGGGCKPVYTSVTLPASAWAGADDPYSQVVSIEGVTPNSKVDLLPSVEQLAIFHDKDIAFVTENENGVVTVYAVGQKPENDYTMKVTITEVAV